MQNQRITQTAGRPRPLTAEKRLDRMLAAMQGWWQGRTLANIAGPYRISRQRIGAILKRVGCTRTLRRRTNHDRPDCGRRVLAHVAVQARESLLHPLAHMLTVRQRAALAWQALGLNSVDIARRMATRPNNVRKLQAAARWRLQRLWLDEIDWSGLELKLSGRSNAPQSCEALVEGS